MVPEKQLLPDGTDLLHAPDASYKYRLWAGADVYYPLGRPPGMDTRKGIMLKQEIVDVKVKGAEQEMVWVKIRRTIAMQRSLQARDVTERDKLPLRISIEYRWLVFFRSKPNVDLDKVVSPPTDPYYSHSMTATSALLFRFSALTFNAHAVHIDPEYTKNEYGLPGLLVHGPLTFVLMMEVLARALDVSANERGIDSRELIVFSVAYRNIAPIFAGEEINICCSPMRQDTVAPATIGRQHMREHRNGDQTWEVWVQKMTRGQPTLCVKATVLVGQSRNERRE